MQSLNAKGAWTMKLKTLAKTSVALLMTSAVAISAAVCVGKKSSTQIKSKKVPTCGKPDAEIPSKATAQQKESVTVPEREVCKNGSCPHCPLVILPGINHSPTYFCDENGERIKNADGNDIGGELFIFNSPQLKEDAKELIAPLAKTLLTQRDDGFTDKIYDFVCKAFYVQKNDLEGNNINNLITRRFDYPVSEMSEKDKKWMYIMVPCQSLTEAIGEDHTFFFTFNLVGNIMDSVNELHEYIQMVKQRTGHSKVNFLNVSLGGTVFTGYLDKYGYDDINEVVNVVAALDGTDIIGDFFARNFRIDDEFLYHEYLPMLFAENVDLTGSIQRLADKVNLKIKTDFKGYGKPLGYLANAVLRLLPNQVVRDMLTRAMDGMLESFMLNCPQFWACIPSDRYDALAARYLSGAEHAVLRAKTDEYHRAQLNFDDNVLAAVNAGVEINNICAANLAFGDVEYSYFSIMDSALKDNSDAVIQIDSTSMGAYGAAPGKKLPDGYKQAKTYAADPSYSYISPDGCVDASTSILPDNTWVFCYQHHEVGRNCVVLNLALDLLTDPELKDVHSKPDKWKQFNGTMNTHELSRWIINDAKKVLSTYPLTANDKAELLAALAQAEALLKTNVTDDTYAEQTLERLNAALVKAGFCEEPRKASKLATTAEYLTELLSEALLDYYGANGYSDGGKICTLIKNALNPAT